MPNFMIRSTLLKCVTGRLSTHAGTLDVFGKSPGSPDHEIPGRLLGYMPQEEALYPEFTVSATETGEPGATL